MNNLLLLAFLCVPFFASAEPLSESEAFIEAARTKGGLPSESEAVIREVLEREGLSRELAGQAARRLLLPEAAGVSARMVIRNVVVTQEIENLRAGGGEPAATLTAIQEKYLLLDFTPGEAEFLARKTLAVPRTVMSVSQMMGEALRGPKPVAGRNGVNVIELRPRPRPR